MKKLLASLLVLSVVGGTSVLAAEQSTYTERFIQKHTQKLVDTEKKLQEQQKAREEAQAKRQKELQKKQQERQKALEKQRKEREKARAAQQKKIEKKKELWNQLIND